MADFKKYYFDYRVANFHVLVSVLFGLFLFSAGEAFKYMMAPYVAYLMIYRREEHMPSILIIMSYGTVLTVFGGFITIGMSLYKLKEIQNANYSYLWKGLLFMLPYYLYITAARLSSGSSITESLSLLDNYMAFWFVLYGVMNYDLYSRRMMNYFLFPLIILLEMYILQVNVGPGIKSLFRITTWIEAVLIITAYKALTREISLKRSVYMKLALLIFIPTRIVMFSSYKFTFLIGLVISFLFLYKRDDFSQTYPELLKIKYRRLARYSVVFSIAFLITALVLTPLYVGQYSDVDLNNYFSGRNSLVDVVLAKLFVDRGVLWISVIDGFANNMYWLPPLEIPKINLEILLDATRSTEVDFESHNILLELVRTQGLLFGVALSVLLLKQLFRLVNNMVGNDPSTNIYRATLFGIGIAIFTTGQFIIKLYSYLVYYSLIVAYAVDICIIAWNYRINCSIKKIIGYLC